MVCMYTQHRYLEVHAQHVEASVIAAIQNEPPQGVGMLPESLQHLIVLLHSAALLANEALCGSRNWLEHPIKDGAVPPSVTCSVPLIHPHGLCMRDE